jgi:murein DD-endopeptidase MepM/ murein hydrolase activator NlpD
VETPREKRKTARGLRQTFPAANKRLQDCRIFAATRKNSVGWVFAVIDFRRWADVRDWTLRVFPERHLYVRSGGVMHTVTLTTQRQVAFAALVTLVLTWTLVSTAAVAFNALVQSSGEQAAARTKAYYERLIADRQARLNSAVAELSEAGGSMSGLAESIENRHAALALLLNEVRGAPGAAQALAPVQPTNLAGKSPVEKIRAVQMDQERLVAAAEGFAKSRADRLRLAFRLAGLNPAAFTAPAAAKGRGGPLIEARDPRALAAILDVDEAFAARIQTAAEDLNALRSLRSAAEALPLKRPVGNAPRSSSYGVRTDPFTGRPAFHAGQDFAGGYRAAVVATGPGVVSFTGVRSGYGNTVEIDHGHGFKTRYAHLQSVAVKPGQRVAIGQRIGAMGSTGRSTGVHLHYEIWENGRVQNPARFLKAGDYVQQAG